MADSTSTFSESWYRVANQRLCLRPGVRVRRQNFRGERWFVLENPFTNEYFRIRPEAYEFVARLDPRRTVEEVWRDCLEKHPDDAPGQEAVLQLLSQLYFSNLLQYDQATDAANLFERFKKRQQQEWRSRLLNIMFMRFPLLDPDRFLVHTLPVVGKFISWFGAILWLVVVGAGIKVVADNWDALVAGDLVDEPVVERDIVDLALGPSRGGRQQVIRGRDLPEVGVGGHLDAHPLQLPHEGRDVPLLGRGDPRIGLHGAVAVEDRGVARVGGILTGRVHEGCPGGLLRGGVDRGRRGRGPGSEGARGL